MLCAAASGWVGLELPSNLRVGSPNLSGRAVFSASADYEYDYDKLSIHDGRGKLVLETLKRSLEAAPREVWQ